MKTVTVTDGLIVVDDSGALDGAGNPRVTRWAIGAPMIQKQQGEFAADIAAAPKAERDKLAALLAAEQAKAAGL